MTKGKGATRTETNPYNELRELMDQQGMMQFKVQVTRQDPQTKQWKSLIWWPGLSAEDISHVEEIVQAHYGGGNYVAGIANNADPRQKLINYAFSIEGAPKYPTGDQGMNNPYNPYGQPPYGQPQQQGFYGQMQPGFQGPQIHPGVMQPPMGYGFPYHPPYPMPWPPPYYPPQPQKDSGPSPEETALREQLKASQKQHDDLMRKLDEEKHQRELDRRDNDTTRKLDQLASQHKEELAKITAALEKTSDKDSNTMLTTMLELNKGTQEAIIEMKKSEVASTKANLEMQMKQIEKDFDQRKQMMDWVRQAQDPGKHAELLERFGQFAANQLNMITAIAQSGLLQQQDNEPTWMQPLREVIDGAKEFGNKWIDNQEQRQRGRQQQGRQTYSHFPQRQLVPPPGGYGGQAQLPPQQQQQQPPPPTGDVVVGDIPQSMQLQFRDIGEKIYLKKDPAKVAEMLYNVVDYGRYWDHIPELRVPEWLRIIFARPKDTIRAVLAKFAPQVKPDEEYLEELEFHFLEVHKQFIAETGQGQPQETAEEQPPQEPPEESPAPQIPPPPPPGEGPGDGASMPKAPAGTNKKKGKKKGGKK